MRLTRFGDYTFPTYDTINRMGASVASGNYVSTAAGAYDPYGDDTIVTGPFQIRRRMTLVATSAAALETAMDEVRALKGTKKTLYGRTAAGYTRRAKARCAQVLYDQSWDNVIDQPVDLIFELLTDHWNGNAHTDDGWYLDSGKYFDDGWMLDSGNEETMASSPHTFTVTNGGNKDSTYNIIVVTAGSAAITSVRIQNTTSGLSDITWTGTLAAGNELRIDCGTFSVTNDGTNAYSGITVNSGHSQGPWLSLAPGNNEIDITFAGGSTDSTVGMEFWDGWA